MGMEVESPMFMIIRDSTGRRREAILLALSVDGLQPMDFAGGEPVKIEGMVSGADLSGFCSQPLRPGRVA
jgi:hypothetical protein